MSKEVSKTVLSNDEINDQMSKFFEKLDLNNKSSAIVKEKKHETSNEEYGKVQVKKRNILFEGAKSDDDQLIFVSYHGAVQPFDMRHKKFAKRPALSRSSLPASFAEDSFKFLIMSDLYKRKLLYQDLTHVNGIHVESQIVIKVGCHYLMSKLFKWNSVTIKEFNDLLAHKYSHNDSRYYNRPRYPSKKDSRDAFKCSYTDRETLNDLPQFQSNLHKLGFEHVKKEESTYKLIMSNKRNTIYKLVEHLDIDEEIKKELIKARDLSIKFDQNFQLKQIELYDKDTRNFDILRGSNKFDIRVQAKTFESITSDSYEKFDLIKEAFKNVLSKHDEYLKITIDPADINLLKMNTASVYQDSTKKTTFKLKINNFVEYKESNRSGLMIAAASIDNHVRMKSTLEHLLKSVPSNFSFVDFQTEEHHAFYDELWKSSIWLSEASSIYGTKV